MPTKLSRAVSALPASRCCGFTLVELTLVVLLLGVLVATALPRFLHVDEDEHTAKVEGVVAALRTGLVLFQHRLRSPEFSNLLANDLGFPFAAKGPQRSASIANAQDCADVWIGLLQGAAPSISAVQDPAELVGSGSDFTALLQVDSCHYVHTAAGNELGDRVADIVYNTSTGEIEAAQVMLRPKLSS